MLNERAYSTLGYGCAASEYGAGSTFSVHLPIVIPDVKSHE